MKITKKQLRRIIREEITKETITENAIADLAMLDYLWKNLKVPGVIGDFFDSKGSKGVNDKIDDWFKNNMGNPLVRGLYKSMMLMGSPPDKYRHDKNWEKSQRTSVNESTGHLSAGMPIDTFDKVEALQPGDKVSINGRACTIVDVDSFSATLVYVIEGKATLKNLDYRMAVRFDDDPEDLLPEIEIVYSGKGQLPSRLQSPRRKTGAGRSYSYYD